MPFRRKLMPGPIPAGPALTADMAGIGMNFATTPNPHANIEDTLVFASEVGMLEDDLRVLSVLTTWFGVHHQHVNADRLVRVILQHSSERVRAYWSAVATWLDKDRRFARLVSPNGGAPVDLLPVGTAFQIARRGEDDRFAGSSLRVPDGTLRDRASDVITAERLAYLHPGYRNRILMGPSWRADVWTVLQRSQGLRVAEVARRAYCSFATAWQVVQDFELLCRIRQGDHDPLTEDSLRSA